MFVDGAFHSFLNVSTVINCFSSVQSLSRVRLLVTPWTAARQASLSINYLSIKII